MPSSLLRYRLQLQSESHQSLALMRWQLPTTALHSNHQKEWGMDVQEPFGNQERFAKNHRMGQQLAGLKRLSDLPELRERAKEVLDLLSRGEL